jgi:hypothetical protein
MELNKYPVLDLAVYIYVLYLVYKHLVEHVKRFEGSNDNEFIKILLIGLVIIGIYEFINTSKKIVVSGKEAKVKIGTSREVNVLDKAIKSRIEK